MADDWGEEIPTVTEPSYDSSAGSFSSNTRRTNTNFASPLASSGGNSGWGGGSRGGSRTNDDENISFGGDSWGANSSAPKQPLTISSQIKVEGMPFASTLSHVREIFGRYGRFARIVVDHQFEEQKSIFYLDYVDPRHSQSALTKNRQDVNGRKLTVVTNNASETSSMSAPISTGRTPRNDWKNGDSSSNNSRGGGGDRGRGGGRGPPKCFKCNEEGHMSRECPTGGGGGGGSRGPKKCFNCNKEGHTSRDCTEERKPRNHQSNGSSGSTDWGISSKDSGSDGWGSGGADGWGASTTSTTSGGDSGWGASSSGGDSGWGSTTTAASNDNSTGGGWGSSGDSGNSRPRRGGGNGGGRGGRGGNRFTPYDKNNRSSSSNNDSSWSTGGSTGGADGWGSEPSNEKPAAAANDGWGGGGASSDDWGATPSTKTKEASSDGWGSSEPKTTTTISTAQDSYGGWD